MEIGKEKAVMVPASTMGLLLAMASNTKWETENSAWPVAAVHPGHYRWSRLRARGSRADDRGYWVFVGV